MICRFLSCALILLCSSGAQAQFWGLRTNSDGSTLYFVTELRLRGTDQLPWPKLFRLSGGRFSLEAEFTQIQRDYMAHGEVLQPASLSSTGGVFAVNSYRRCFAFGGICGRSVRHRTSISSGGAVKDFVGYATISAQGRYALLVQHAAVEFEATNSVNRLDLQSNALEPLGERPATEGSWIAADGTVLARPLWPGTLSPPRDDDWVLISPGGERRTLKRAPASLAILAPDASYILYQDQGFPNAFVALPRLMLRRVDGRDELIAAAAASPSVTADSRSVLYLSPAGAVLQAFLRDLISGAVKQVSYEAAGLKEAVISGDGTRVWAVTGDGELISIDARTGDRSSFTAKLPAIEQKLVNRFDRFNPGTLPDIFVMRSNVPGLAYFLYGSNFDPASVRVSIKGVEAPVVAATSNSIAYLVPEHVPPSEGVPTPREYEEVVVATRDPQWEAVFPIYSVAPDAYEAEAIRLGMDGGTEVNAIHGDWRGLVTSADPATPGEIIHIYATGVGPVDAPVPAGQPSPADPPSRLRSTPDCRATSLGPGGSPVPVSVPYAGLAPGLIGIFQLSFQLPDQLRGEVVMGCSDWNLGMSRILVR